MYSFVLKDVTKFLVLYTPKMIEELLKDIRELRNEMVQKNWPAQRLSNIILKYEMKLQENKHKYTTEELVEATNKILNDD